MGRKGGVTEMGGEAVWCREAVAAGQMGGIPWELAISAPGQTAQPMDPAPEDRFPLPLAVKTSGD